MPKNNNLKIIIHNVETNEIIERDMTTEELAQYEQTQLAEATKQAEAEAKAAERQAILDRLGLTADEAKLILG
jgi:FMN-dependent NADH-azoreductase